MPGSIPLPSDTTDPIVLADWLELLALNADDGNSSHGDLERGLNRLGADDIDSICKDSMMELNRRVIATAENYPFSFSGTLLAVKGDWRGFTPYVFCLLLSYCDNKKKKTSGLRHEVMFEQLSCIAARNYIGGEAVRFGAPRKELPAGFRDALHVLCEKVQEWSCSHRGKTLRKKDDGLDLVAWKPFPDRRIGKVILFGHCASGGDWDEKINELQPNDFCSKWLGGDRSPIVKTFFIPHRLSQEVWDDRAISAKLFFDRCRIAYWAKNDEFCEVTKQNSIKWCECVLDRITS
ncbi:MAG: hypothetical protein Q7R68_06065 [Nitrospirales bacterium]|nr:hypothetical protein [Nitrospirales bacterium]